MNSVEPTLEEAFDNIEKSVELLIEVQWKLHDLGTLSATVYDGLFDGTVDLMTLLAMASPERAVELTNKLFEKRIDKEAIDGLTDLENLLRDNS